MQTQNSSLEDSNGKIIDNPSKEQVLAAVERLGAGLDHCILSIGTGSDFVQSAGSKNKLCIQYRDASGMFESARGDFDAATVGRVFIEALNGADGWKSEFVFEPMETPETGRTAGDERPGPGPQKSLKDELLDMAARGVADKLNRFAKKGLGGLFGKK